MLFFGLMKAKLKIITFKLKITSFIGVFDVFQAGDINLIFLTLIKFKRI